MSEELTRLQSPPPKIMTTMTVEMEVSPDWVQFVTGGVEGTVDIFFRNGYCGYWMEGIAHDSGLGWLAYEHGALDRHSTTKERMEAIQAWKDGNRLPEHFHALNLEMAKKSWVEGIKANGMQWYENGDGCTYDCAIQRALFDKVVYG